MVARAMRCLYADLDGTLLGPGGSVVHGADGRFALEGVRALQACDRAGAEVVLYSGRRQQTVFEDSRLLGLGSYIFELGCGLVVDGELEWLTGGIVPSAEAGTIYDQIDASGAPRLLLERYAGRLEYHTPWSRGRDVSHLFRGLIDLDQAHALLREAGLGWLRLVDNGVIHEHMAPMTAGQAEAAIRLESSLGPDLPIVRAYHLIPAAASKSRAVARHMQIRGYATEECIAVGDSREDLGASEVVGAFWLVANALERDPTLSTGLSSRVRVASAPYGAGVYEAVVTTLAERER
jgi:hydroxymethylpyrimidine pyrophosphatase-like HAD family hydrolase